MLTIEAHVRNELGECPLWCERTRRLYWTDIEGRELLAMQEDSEEISRWSLPERLGSFALTDEENVLLMGFESRLGYYDLQNGIFTLVAASPGARGTRINDGRCDRAGNFVFSSMHDGNPLQAIGKFHRLDAATLETETLSLPAAAIPNSICFSPDGGTMYYSDSMQGRIFCCDYPSISEYLLKSKAAARLMVPALMRRAICGTQNVAVAGSFATALEEKFTASCLLLPFRRPVRYSAARL